MTIFESSFKPIDIPTSSLVSFALRHATRLADKPALIDGPSGRSLTYAQLEHAVKAFAGGLAARGFGKGDVLAIMAPNVPEYAIAFLGTLYAGGLATTVNPTYTARELRHQLHDSGAKLLVTVSVFAQTANEALQGTQVQAMATIDPGPGESLKDWMGAPMETPVACAPDDVACLPYSSGTTGLSKGVMLTHRNLVANVLQFNEVVPTLEGEAILAFLPFFHIYGMQILMNVSLAQGACVVTMPRFDLEQFLTLASKHRVRRAYVVPPVVLALAKHPLVGKFDLSALEHVLSGAAPLGADLSREVQERLGVRVTQGYGMTELSPVSHASAMGHGKLGSGGKLLPLTRARIVNPDTHADFEVDQDGELWVQGPQVMAGYLNNPEATAITIVEDGWLRTGDIGHIDSDGFLFVVDRLKELIKYKGFQVPPAELESIVLTHPAIADAAVVGVPDPEAGELPKAFVVLKPGAELTAAALQEFVAGQVAHYKQLRIVEFLPEIPKSASGKILRRVLRDRHS